jgi:hypothetical protein
MIQSQQPISVVWLPRITLLTGLGFLVFFSIAAVGILFNLDQHIMPYEWGQLVMRMVRWGHQGGGGEHYELMIAVIYIVWGLFLIKASREPLAHKLFMDFTLLGNAGHFGLMFFQGLLMKDEHIHLAGDVMLGWLLLAIFAITWLPARKYASDPASS